MDLAVLLSIKKACDGLKESRLKDNNKIANQTLKGIKPYLDIYDARNYTAEKVKKADKLLMKTLIKFVKFLPQFWE